MPQKLKYFLDPLRVIKNYKGCKLYPTKSKLYFLELGSVWKFISGGRNLNSAHDSLVDAKAQTDVLLHLHFVQYINRTVSIQEITDIFTKTQQDAWKKVIHNNQTGRTAASAAARRP